MTTPDPVAGALSTEGYWSDVWEYTSLRPVDPRHHYDRELIRTFQELGPILGGGPVRILEIGCGNSMWLPFFARRFGWSVTGIDYSDLGCELARRNLAAEGVPGEILHRDLFVDNADLQGRFDVVYSAGFLEHFADPVGVVKLMERMLRPGGVMVTAIPNLYNLATFVQRYVGPKTLALHYFIKLSELRHYHEAAGLRRVKAHYVGFGGIVVPDRPDGPPSAARPSLRRRFLRAFVKAGAAAARGAVQWARRQMERWGEKLPRTEKFSPVVLYVGRKHEPGVPA